MAYLKKLGLACLFCFGLILVLTFVLTLFNYINFINNGLFVFFMIFNLILSVFVGSFVLGKRALKKGWLEGIKFGALFLIIVALIDYLGFDYTFNVKFIVFSIIILVSSLFGGMVGISFRKEEK